MFDEVLLGRVLAMNRTQNNIGYYLVDDIYPNFATFVKTISMPQGEKRKLFAQRQELARKDVERVFRVLQFRFVIIYDPTHFWDASKTKNIIYACIILHNMIVEHECDTYQNNIDYDSIGNNTSTFEVSLGVHPSIRSTPKKSRGS